MRKRKTIPLALFILLAVACSFLFATSSHAITITGSDTITTNSNATYTATGCSGSVSWSVTGPGASISQNGVLTTGSASCGAITITARCSDGSITTTKTVRVTNAGYWALAKYLYCNVGQSWSAEGSCEPRGVGEEIVGQYKMSFWSHIPWRVYYGGCTAQLAASCYEPQTYGFSLKMYKSCGLHCGVPFEGWLIFGAAYLYKWQCPPCTNGQTLSCYTGATETKNKGECKAGTQTCTSGQWGACQGEITPVAEICGDGKDNNCNGQVDEGCAVCTDGQTKPCAYSGPAETENVGICRAGTQTCSNGQWGDCKGEILPTQEVCGDGLDNNCNGQVDEECEKILKYVSGNGQEEDICKTLKDPFVVSANAPDAGINWQITDSPAGSNPSISQSVTTMTDNEILSSAYLKLGSLPGSYTTEARCSECTSGSPQVFAANAICPEVPAYSQGDSRWGDDTYDNICAVGINPTTKKKYGVKSCEKDSQGNILSTEIPYTIAGKGCAMTSMAMVMGRYGSQAKPDEWNAFMTKSGGYTSGGVVQWKIATATNAQILIKSIDGILDENEIQMSLQKTLMDKYLAKCIPVIVKVVNPATGNRHWVVVTSKQDRDYAINDPANQFGLLSQYGDIYAIRIYAKEGGDCR